MDEIITVDDVVTVRIGEVVRVDALANDTGGTPPLMYGNTIGSTGGVPASYDDNGTPDDPTDDVVLVSLYDPGSGEVPLTVRYFVEDAAGNTAEGVIRVNVEVPPLPDAPPGPLVVTTAADVLDPDDGVLSLREAVEIADSRPGEDLVLFADSIEGETLELVRPLRVDDDLVIDGDEGDGGAGSTVIAGAYTPRLPGLPPAFFTRDIQVTDASLRLEDLTLVRQSEPFGFSSYIGVAGQNADIELVRAGITGGDDSPPTYGILTGNGGSVTLVDSFVSDQGGQSTLVAGIRAFDGDITLIRSEVTGMSGTNPSGRGEVSGIKIRNGELELIDSSVSDIEIVGDASTGGARGIFADNVEVTLTNSSVTGVESDSGNATALLAQGSDVELVRSEVTGNRSGGFIDPAVAIDADADSRVVLRESTVSDNYGPSVSVISTEGELLIERSLIASNSTGEFGDVVSIRGGSMDMVNSTVARNFFVGYDAGGPYYSNGVIHFHPDTAGTITNSTVAGQELDVLFNETILQVDRGAEVVLENNLLTVTSFGSFGAPAQGPGTVVSNGGNVFDSPSVGFDTPADVTGVDPADLFAELDADGLPLLRDNGGPTQTVALLDDPANPAIGLADPATAPATDQRGFARDDDPDAGAFEVQGEVEPAPDALTVAFVSEDADFANSLGYYLKGEDGRPTGEAGILFEEATEDALNPGDSATLEDVDESEVGFFLIRDGANLGLDFDAGVEVRGERLKVGDVLLKRYQVHFDAEEGQLLIQESFPPRYLWEDKALSEGSYDGDFDDAVFEVTFSTGYAEDV